ncbi:MAG: hypothetical protein CMH83_16505 [Nocardioides sp.]|nr:hypothetical protein [Nocardioides sp.]
MTATAAPTQTYEPTRRNTTMNGISEDLARAHRDARLAEARDLRAGHQLARARRLSRKAERAAQQARLAIARAL